MNNTMRLIIGSAITLVAGSMRGQAAPSKAVRRYVGRRREVLEQ